MLKFTKLRGHHAPSKATYKLLVTSSKKSGIGINVVYYKENLIPGFNIIWYLVKYNRVCGFLASYIHHIKADLLKR